MMKYNTFGSHSKGIIEIIRNYTHFIISYFKLNWPFISSGVVRCFSDLHVLYTKNRIMTPATCKLHVLIKILY